MSLSLKPELRLDWCSYDAALYSVKRWHYSKSLPCSKTARLGVWENQKFVGAVVFAWGANNRLAEEYGLKIIECAELSRVALTEHETPVSKIISIACKMVKRAMPGIRLIVSFADPEHGHIGTVYQGAGWIYVGARIGASCLMVNGKVTHRRTISSRYGTSAIAWIRQHVDATTDAVHTKPKFKYLLALDNDMRQKILPLRKPYPKRATSETSDTPGLQPGEGRAARTVAL